MKTFICPFIFLALGLFSTCHSAGPPISPYDLLATVKGREYVALRQSLLNNPLKHSPSANIPVEVKYLLELFQARQKNSQVVSAFDRIIAKDLQKRKDGIITEKPDGNVRGYAPLAGEIGDLAIMQGTDKRAIRLIALASFEYIWKLADDEYEVFNLLRVFNRIPLMNEVKNAMLPQIVLIVEKSESSRIAIEALSLLCRNGLPSNDPRVLETAIQKHPDEPKVSQLSAAIS